MQKYFINNNSDKLILFFAGWACDEHEFSHLSAKSDVLILYNYLDLELDFDFTKYKEINLLAFSAGVFVSSIFKHNLKIKRSLGVCGNPYLFDEHYGLSKETVEIFKNITDDTALDFCRNYLVQTDEEFEVLKKHQSRRTIDSSNKELDALYEIYIREKENIKPVFDIVLAGDNDEIFPLETQQEFFKDKLCIVKNARHNIFYRLKNYEDVFRLAFN